MVRVSSCLLGVALLAAAVQAPRAAAPTPIVVELFTSEGCSSCPPADTLLEALVDRQPIAGAQVIGLGLHVDYWDHQGWRDRFSSAALTNRQRIYQAKFGTDSIYTPQMVVDGRAEFVGSDGKAARRAIERAAAAAHATVRIAIEPAGSDRLAVAVTASDVPRAASGPLDIVMALTENRLQSDVKRGENEGRVMRHAAVVRHLATIGEAIVGSGFRGTSDLSARADIRLERDWQRGNLHVVAFLQERRGRTIVGAAAAPVQPAR